MILNCDHQPTTCHEWKDITKQIPEYEGWYLVKGTVEAREVKISFIFKAMPFFKKSESGTIIRNWLISESFFKLNEDVKLVIDNGITHWAYLPKDKDNQ